MSAHTLAEADLRRIATQSRFCVKAFARLVGVEVRTLERRFAQEFGCTPDEWLAEQRMSDAAVLLQRGFNAKEVAAGVAYKHASSFFREFRRRRGCTPKEFTEARRIRLRDTDAAPLSQTAILLSQTATSRGLRLGEAV